MGEPLQAVDPGWWESASFECKPIRAFLAERDMSAVLRFLKGRGFSRSRLAGLTGLSETRIRAIIHGRQRVTSYDVLERCAVGLGIPRAYLGIAGLDELSSPLPRRCRCGGVRVGSAAPVSALAGDARIYRLPSALWRDGS